MPFFKIKLKQERTSLRQHNTLRVLTHTSENSKQKKQIDTYSRKRVSRLASFTGRPGSLTVETALVLPVFLFAMITLIYFGESVRFSNNLQNSLHQNAKELSQYAYVSAKSDTLKGLLGGKIGGAVFTHTYVKNCVEQDLKKNGQDFNVVKNKESGVYYFRSSILKDDMIDLVANYQVDTPFDFLGIRDFRMTNRARMRAWTGYDNTQKNSRNTEEEIVFITKDGSVYHKSRNCSHLDLTIKSITVVDVPGLRNKDGSKYYPCEYCGNKNANGAVYITDYGDRYHTSINCSGLKRDIIALPISKVNGRPPCKTCGR